MEHICETCFKDPTSHSFSQVDSIDNIQVFYTCPSIATKYYDKIGILEHYENTLNHHGSKPWIWIFDGKDFELKHALEISTGIEIAKMITNKFSDNLRKIYIINANWYIHTFYNVVHPFLSQKVRDLIVIIDSN